MTGIDAVTADGRQVHADATKNADLYWAARGAGPGFPALVTRFYLRTHPQTPVMMQDTWTFPVQAAEPLLAWLHEILPGLDRPVEPVVAATRRGPRMEFRPTELSSSRLPASHGARDIRSPLPRCPRFRENCAGKSRGW